MLYNLVDRLNKENEKCEIEIEEGKKYTINNSAAAVIAIQSIVKKQKNKKDVSEEEQMEQLFDIRAVGIGKEATEYIKEKGYTITALNTIVSAISAATINQTLEEFEEENKKAEKEETPSVK